MGTFRNNTSKRLMVPDALPPRIVGPDETFEVADSKDDAFERSHHFVPAAPPKPRNTAKKGDDA